MTAVVDQATDALLARAGRVIPNGVSAGGRDVYRDVIVRAQGAYLWNAAGRRLLDHLLAYGPIVVGHADPRINRGGRRDRGAGRPAPGSDRRRARSSWPRRSSSWCPRPRRSSSSTPAPTRCSTPLHVARAPPGEPQCSSSMATTTAGRARWASARTSTSRPARRPPRSAELRRRGAGVAARTTVVDWNDADGRPGVFAAHGADLLPCSAEPYLHSYTNAAPAPGFLELLRELTYRHGALLVFDEVKTGFRHHLGGYQAIAGVTPDLTALARRWATAGRSPPSPAAPT